MLEARSTVLEHSEESVRDVGMRLAVDSSDSVATRFSARERRDDHESTDDVEILSSLTPPSLALLTWRLFFGE